jgi:gliding motility-associated-like protein
MFRWSPILLSLACLCLNFTTANAQWLYPGGIPIHGNLSNGQDQVQMATTAAHDGVVYVWRDGRPASNGDDIYAQKIDPCGNLLWGPNGTLVCDATAQQRIPNVIADDAGGAIFIWEDTRGSDWEVYVQRFDGNGVAQWAANGIPVTSVLTGNDQRNPIIATDGAGGAVVVWEDNRPNATSGTWDAYGQRISSAGVLMWGATGAPVCIADGNQQELGMDTDSLGGAFVAWQDTRGNTDLYGIHIDNTGNPSAGWMVGGDTLANGSGAQRQPAVAYTGVSGGVPTAIVTYRDQGANFIGAIRLDVNANILPGWNVGGNVVGTALTQSGNPGNAQSPDIAADKKGGAYISYRSPWGGGDNDVLTVHISYNGVPLIGASNCNGCSFACSGAMERTAFGLNWEGMHVIAADGYGGAVNVFEDRNGPTRIQVRWFGNIPGIGVVSENSSGNKHTPDIAAMCGVAYTAWDDNRAAAIGSDIYAASTSALGPPPRLVSDMTLDTGCCGIDNSITLCQGDTVNFTVALPFGLYNNYEFFDGATSIQNSASNTYEGVFAPGTHTITVVSNTTAGCYTTNSNTITVIVNPAPTITTVLTDPLCNGDSNGSIVVTASGGITPYTYSNDDGVSFQGSNTFSGLGANTYYLVVQDGGGCQARDTVTLTDPPLLTFTTTDVNPVCNGGATGSITFSANGGVTPYQYSIDNGVTFQAGTGFTGLTANTYNVVVEDANGCSATGTVTLTEPSALTFTTTDVDPDCNGASTGSITFSANGGTTPYQYSTDNGVTFQAGNAFTGLTAGTYNVVVEDANGCSSTGTVTLTDPPVLIFTTTDVDPDCNGASTGSITFSASGGTTPYQYSTDNGVTFQAGNAFAGLPAGTYNVIVEDANGCQASGTVTLTDPAPITFTTTAVQPGCAANNGSITISASGGTTPYQYSDDNGVTFQAGNSFTGLAAGTYNLVVQDANGCTASGVEVLTNPSAPTIDNVVTTDPNCNGGSDGTITITASGGTTPYQYSIDNGVTFQAGNNFTGLPAGTYDIIVEDAAGCQVASTVTLTDPPALGFTTVDVDPDCNGASTGSITFSANGGTTPYQYSTDNGVTFQAGNAFTGLPAGTYNVVVEDANGCSSTGTVTLTDPPVLTFTTTDVDPDCNGASTGSITFSASGGTTPYQYSTDNGVTFQAGNAFTGLPAGTYNVIVEDANGCQAAGTVTLTDPAPITFTTTAVQPGCAASNGSITISASGGTTPYQYSDDNGVTFQAGNSFTGLAAGTYNLVVQDANGCTASGVEVLTNPSAPTIDNVVTTDPNCNGGSDGTITITASGGTTPYQYSIDNGVTFQAGNNFTGLPAGTYDIIVEDAAGCQVASTVTLTDPPALGFTTVDVDPDCNGAATGSITFTASGGTTPYQYSTDNGVTFQAGNAFTGLTAGTYNVVVEDANGCSSTGTVTLTDPAAVTFTTVDVDPDCNGSSTGSITFTASGGTTPYQYSTDNGVTFQAGNGFTGLPAGTYNVIVEDANGCSASGVVTLTDPPALSYTTAIVSPSCGANDGSITITESGGTSPYQYSIDNGVTYQGSGVFANLPVGTYTIVVLDANGCTVTGIENLTNPSGPSISNIASTDPSCNGLSDGSIIITATGGQTPYQYSTDGGVTFQGGNSFSGLPAGTYNIVVEDQNGCQTAGSITLTDPPVLSFTSVDTDPDCNGALTGSIAFTASGGTTPYQYSSDNGVTFQAGSTISGLAAGTYSVIVEDANGCQSSGTVTLTDPPAITFTSSSADPLCNGGSDGTIDVTAAGGTGTLQYSSDGGVTFQAGNQFSNLPAGSYTIVVEDANGCSATATVTLTDPAAITYTVVITDASCGNNDGALVFTASGGTGPYQYSTDGGTTFQASASFSNLAANTYSVVIEDANGCQVTGSETVNNVGGVVLDSATGIDPLCAGGTDGSISIAASSGTTPYQFSVDNGVTFQAGSSFAGLTAGTYSIVITDVGGCSATGTVTLTDPSALAITITATDATCGEANGVATAVVSGGASPYTYSWTSGSVTDSESGLLPGSYSVTITDANGCTAIGSAIILDDNTNCSDELFVPTVFSPNGDGNNDVFFVRGNGIEDLRFVIYNRWGEVVFESTNPDSGWDGTYKGKPVDSGVFIYMITAKMTGETKELSGDVTLLR